MNIGDTYRHKYLVLNCEILDFTKKGYKVKEYERYGKKSKISYYYFIDFHPINGYWIKI